MPYCALDDVNALVPQVPYTATSKPSAEAVVGFIEQVSTRMDATLGNLGYRVPVVSGDQSLALLREACAWGALGLAEQVRNTAVPTAVTEYGRPIRNIWLQQFDEWMKRLADNGDPFRLPDALHDDVAVEKQGEHVIRSFVQSVDDPNYRGNEPVISRYQVL